MCLINNSRIKIIFKKNMSLLIDEYGRPIILFDSSDTKERLKGAEAYNVKNLSFLIIFIKFLKYSQTF